MSLKCDLVYETCTCILNLIVQQQAHVQTFSLHHFRVGPGFQRASPYRWEVYLLECQFQECSVQDR